MNGRHEWLIPVVAVLILLAFDSGACGAETGAVLTLQKSIDMALQQSVMIHAAQEGVKGAEAQKKEAFKEFLPKFSTSYNYTRPQ